MQNRKSKILPLALLLGLALLVALFWYLTRPPQPAGPPLRLEDTGDITGFARAFEPVPFDFPRDHGPHPDFQTEWWYYTGNLAAPDGRRFGYQLTFFRRALTPTAPERLSGFATNQIYFAHLALTDVAGNEHTSFERFSRGAAGLAGATGEPFTVWIEDWRAESLDALGSQVRLTAAQDGLALDLTLRAVKPLVAHGDLGLSPKSPEPGNASYYLSYTRLETTGAVTLPGQSPLPVTGESWFDHEWSTSALGAGAIGWDWFSLQLSDGQELMYFQIRREDGSLEPASSGTLVAPDGTLRRLAAADLSLQVLETWRSPLSGAVYPAAWRLEIPSADIDLTLRPWIADQEMDVSFVYWEGAVRLEGLSASQPITGRGYVELTGYAASIAGQF
jgi:predicted secreted hydrolase